VLCKNHADPDRITIQSEMPWAGGYVRYNPKEFSQLGEMGHTRQELLDDLCVLVGGIEAERLIAQAWDLLAPNETGTGFARRYFEALQRDPDVVLAHGRTRKMMEALG
jgi:hypothetical protein